MEESHVLSKRRFKTLILTVLASLLVYFLFILWGGWHDVVTASYKIGFWGVAIALLLSTFNMTVRFIRWQFFVALQGYHIPWKTHFRIYLSGFALTPTPAKAGETLRSVFLADFHVPYRVSFAVFFSERFSDLLSVSVIISLGFWNISGMRWVIFFLWAGILAFLLLMRQVQWVQYLRDYFLRKGTGRFVHFMDYLLDGILSFNNCFAWYSLLGGTLLGIVAWSGNGLAFCYILNAMGADISFFWANFNYVLSMLVGALTFIPGGIGGSEVTLVQLLVHQNVALPDAIAATLFIRFATLWFSVLLGLLFLPLKRILLIK